MSEEVLMWNIPEGVRVVNVGSAYVGMDGWMVYADRQAPPSVLWRRHQSGWRRYVRGLQLEEALLECRQ